MSNARLSLQPRVDLILSILLWHDGCSRAAQHILHRLTSFGRLWRGRVVTRLAMGVTACLCASVTPAMAIPSPELIVGSITSLSQLAVLVSALFGGGALTVGAIGAMRAGSAAEQRKQRRARRLFIACLAVATASLTLNIILYVQGAGAEAERLQAALLKPTPLGADGQPLDANLAIVSYADQQNSPLGLGTAQGAKLIARADAATVFVDIREPEETELGTLPGALVVRFPDLAADISPFAGKTAVFFCHNGNRSAQTCQRLRALGLDCRFLVGGLEKWLAENRTLSGGEAARAAGQLRALPAYPNQTTLLSTADVRNAEAAGQIQFIDVRYPGEFATGFLPGAINLPIRPTPTDELEQRLETLPNLPVIVPCYDRRSCFYGEILGLKLTRMGRLFLGRYTEPWGYVGARTLPPHVAKLKAAQTAGIWSGAVAWLTEQVQWAADHIGLVWVIGLLALASRIVVLPFALKSDRDQLVMVAAAAELAHLKRTLADAPQRRARALQAFYKRHRLTPGRNALALLFLPVLALSVAAVGTAATPVPTSFLWLQTLSQPDPYGILPAVFTVLFAGYLHAVVATRMWVKWAVWLIAAPGLFYLSATLPAASALYLAVSAVLFVAQRLALVCASGAAGGVLLPAALRWHRFRAPHDGVAPLFAPALLHDAGNKALRLGQMAAAGLPVLPGVVLTAPFMRWLNTQSERRRRRSLQRVWRLVARRRHSFGRVVVRSSAAGEDGAEQSFAGVFDTVLDVQRGDFGDAIDTVCASFSADRAQAYAQASPGTHNIVVQPMFDATFGGVVFTQAPQSPGLMLVELVDGNPDDLVSGRRAPQTFHIGAASGRVLDTVAPPIDLSPLVALARRIEVLFEAPQDIEWAYARGRFVILQARDITTTAGGVAGASAAQIEAREWRSLVAKMGTPNTAAAMRAPVFAQNEMAEVLPRPTPVSLSIVEAMWQPGGSIDQAAHHLGLVYNAADPARDYHVTVFGRLYVDVAEQRHRAIKVPAVAARRLRRDAREVEAQVRRALVGEMVTRVRLLEAADFTSLPARDLVRTFANLVHTHIHDTHVHVDMVNLAARFFVDDVQAHIPRRTDPEAGKMSGPVPTLLRQSLQRALLAPQQERLAHFNEAIGHRAVADYELSVPRFREDEAALSQAAAAQLDVMWQVDDDGRAGKPPAGNKKLRAAMSRARRFQSLKEDAKHVALREYAILRDVILALDAAFDLGGAAFHMTYAELATLDARTRRPLRELATRRMQSDAHFRTLAPLAPTLSAADLELLCFAGAAGSRVPSGDVLKGTVVSGTLPVTARALVVGLAAAEVGAPIAGFEPGDIIIAPIVSPNWLPHIVQAAAVVSEVGGWLSHMSIVAREHDVPMVVGVRGLAAIVTGDRLQIDAEGRIKTLDRPRGQALGATTPEEIPASEHPLRQPVRLAAE